MKYCLILIWMIIFISCENQLDIHLDDTQNKLTLNADLRLNAPFRAAVTKSIVPLTDGRYEVVKDAIVELYENDSFVEILQYEPDDQDKRFGIFSSLNQPKPGRKYTFKVNAPGYKSLEATERMPNSIKNFNIIETYYPQKEGDEKKAKFNLVFYDSSGFDAYCLYAYYYFVEKVKDSLGKDTTIVNYNFDVSREVNLSSGAFFDYTNGLVFSDEGFDNSVSNIVLTTSAEPLELYDQNIFKEIYLVFELRRITENSFKYRKSYAAYLSNNNNGFNEPVLVWTNVKNGFGIVVGSTKISKVIKIR